MHHRVVPQALERTAGPARMAPIGTGDVSPPVVGVAHVHRPRGLAEHHGVGCEQLGLRSRIVGGIGRLFGERHVVGGVDEALELGVGDGVDIHPEAVHVHLVRRRFLGVVGIGSHQEDASGDPGHVVVDR